MIIKIDQSRKIEPNRLNKLFFTWFDLILHLQKLSIFGLILVLFKIAKQKTELTSYIDIFYNYILVFYEQL